MELAVRDSLTAGTQRYHILAELALPGACERRRATPATLGNLNTGNSA